MYGSNAGGIIPAINIKTVIQAGNIGRADNPK
jgi:hypothetical protein